MLPAPSAPANCHPESWIPILDGGLSARAGEAIQAVSQALRQCPQAFGPDGELTDFSLCAGRAGLAVFHTYLAESGLTEDAEKVAVECLNAAVEAVATVPSDPSLYGGFTGTAWAMAHLDDRLFDEDDDSNSSVDEALCEYLSHSPWRGEYDIVSGLVGFGVYALECLPRPTAIACLELVVDRLEETAERTAEGVTWFTPPELLPTHQRKECPDGYYNLGLAHGGPGVIALLGQVGATSDEQLRGVRQKARLLLDGAVRWLLAQEPADRAQCFPNTVGPGVAPKAGRLAWCYGELGIAVALLQAARCARESIWEREALRIAHRAAERPVEQSKVVDCGLCHGAAGVGHLFNRLFQATGDEVFREAACFWFARTLEMRQADTAIAGFPARKPDPERQMRSDGLPIRES